MRIITKYVYVNHPHRCIYRAVNTPSLTETTSESFTKVASLDLACKIICSDSNLPIINWKTISDPLCFESILSHLDIRDKQPHVHLPT